MKPVKHSTCALFLLFAVFLPTENAFAANTRVERESLEKLTPIYILINSPPQWAVDDGITRQVLRARLETIFKDNGVTVSDEQVDNGGVFTVVFAAAGAVSNGKGVFAYISDITVSQNVRLFHNNHPAMAITWSDIRMGGSSSAHEAADYLLEDTMQSTKAFISDYRAINTK